MLWATARGRALSLAVTKTGLDNDGQQVCWSLSLPCGLWLPGQKLRSKWPRANIYSFLPLGTMMGESKGKAKNFRVGRSSVVF